MPTLRQHSWRLSQLFELHQVHFLRWRILPKCCHLRLSQLQRDRVPSVWRQFSQRLLVVQSGLLPLSNCVHFVPSKWVSLVFQRFILSQVRQRLLSVGFVVLPQMLKHSHGLQQMHKLHSLYSVRHYFLPRLFPSVLSVLS
jgi:hypothetical protein